MRIFYSLFTKGSIHGIIIASNDYTVMSPLAELGDDNYTKILWICGITITSNDDTVMFPLAELEDDNYTKILWICGITITSNDDTFMRSSTTSILLCVLAVVYIIALNH